MDKKQGLPIWVLNLKQDALRLAFMSKQLNALGLPFAVVEALDGNLLTEADWKRYSKDRARKFSGRELVRGEVGCALSHARMWERIVRENLPEVMIFEDDVHIAAAFPALLERRERLPADWELINFSTNAAQEPFGDFIFDIYRASRHKDPPNLTSAYLLNTRGARKLLDHTYPIGHTADGLTWRTDITGVVSYGIYPRLVVLADLGSSIWSRGEIKRRGFFARKADEFFLIVKMVLRFFGVTQLLRKIRS
jgi:glycosyl transferase family 25